MIAGSNEFQLSNVIPALYWVMNEIFRGILISCPNGKNVWWENLEC